jgi:hypothetical protein
MTFLHGHVDVRGLPVRAASGGIEVRRYLRVLVIGFALIGLFTGILAKAASRPAHAAGIGMTVPAGGTFAPDPTTGTFTLHLPQPHRGRTRTFG